MFKVLSSADARVISIVLHSVLRFLCLLIKLGGHWSELKSSTEMKEERRDDVTGSLKRKEKKHKSLQLGGVFRHGGSFL